MKAITIQQPFAQMVILGKKGNECRSRATTFRGPVAIHAGKSQSVLKALLKNAYKIGLGDVLNEMFEMFASDYFAPHGAVIGTADLVDCIPMTDEWIASVSAKERAIGIYQVGWYAWRFENPQRFGTPIPARGQLGLWDWQPPATVANIRNLPSGWQADPRYIYCGRASGRRGLRKSKWHNPFIVSEQGTREDAIVKFETYLWERPDLLAQVGELKGKTLVCWCAPEACHCDVLARLANETEANHE